MISDFKISADRPPVKMLGQFAIYKPWVWSMSFKLEGKGYGASLLQESADPAAMGEAFHGALVRLVKRKAVDEIVRLNLEA